MRQLSGSVAHRLIIADVPERPDTWSPLATVVDRSPLQRCAVLERSSRTAFQSRDSITLQGCFCKPDRILRGGRCPLTIRRCMAFDPDPGADRALPPVSATPTRPGFVAPALTKNSPICAFLVWTRFAFFVILTVPFRQTCCPRQFRSLANEGRIFCYGSDPSCCRRSPARDGRRRRVAARPGAAGPRAYRRYAAPPPPPLDPLPNICRQPPGPP